MATKKELKAMDIQDLEKHIQGLDEEKQKLRAEQRKAAEILDEKVAEEQARNRLETMSDPEKAALLQILQTEGIVSEEAHGKAEAK